MIWKGSPNVTKGRPRTPLVIVIHTMAGSLTGSDSWFANPSSKVSSHFGIGLRGLIHQYVALENTAWVNGVRETGNRWGEVLAAAGVTTNYSPNGVTVGIETEDLNNPAQAVTEEQYQATLGACRISQREYASIKVLSSHSVISPKSRANCAGRRWTSGRIQQLAAETGLALVV